MDSLREKIDALVGQELRAALDACGGNQTHAAKMLGVSRRALIYLMEAHGLKALPAYAVRNPTKHRRVSSYGCLGGAIAPEASP